jgi:hypothetical protein
VGQLETPDAALFDGRTLECLYAYTLEGGASRVFTSTERGMQLHDGATYALVTRGMEGGRGRVFGPHCYKAAGNVGNEQVDVDRRDNRLCPACG